MIAEVLNLLSAFILLIAGAGAPDTAPTAPAQPKFSIYEITSPVPYQVVTDEVDIIGSVNSPDFGNYFVEYRPVLDSFGNWYPATLPRLMPVFAERLRTFNTRFLPDGEFDMRLRVNPGYASESTLRFGPIVVRNSQKVVLDPTPEAPAAATEPPVSDVTVVVESPRPGEIVRDSVDFVGTVDAPDLRNFYIEFNSADGDWDRWFPATLPKIESVQSDVLGTWNTITLKDGDYLLRINVLAGAEPRQYFPIGVFSVRNES